MKQNPVYTVRELRQKLKEVLDLAWDKLNDDDFHVVVRRGDQEFALYSLGHVSPKAQVAAAVEQVHDTEEWVDNNKAVAKEVFAGKDITLGPFKSKFCPKGHLVLGGYCQQGCKK